MIFPMEIVEKIISKCDGTTLLQAKKVNDEFNIIVEYFTEKTRIWEWCCNEEIPKNELVDYLQTYKNGDKKKWLKMYINWYSWEHIDLVMTDIVLSPADFPKISCMAITEELIALGSDDGMLRIFSCHWKKLIETRIVTVKLSSVTFIESERSESHIAVTLVMAYKKGLIVYHYDGRNYEQDQFFIYDVKSHSIFKDYVCYEKFGGRLTIAKLIKVNNRWEMAVIWYSRIYSPSCLSSMCMWQGVCTFLINNEVKTIQYDSPKLTPMSLMDKKTNIKFNFPLVDSKKTVILRNDLVISLCRSNENIQCDFIELFILENNKFSKKMFNVWEIFRCFITCIKLYGNMLIIGVDVGTIYLYHVSCWKNLDIREYKHKLIMGKHPITNVEVLESEKGRKIFVSSKFNVHEVSVYVPNLY